jgi:hypothetical protein
MSPILISAALTDTEYLELLAAHAAIRIFAIFVKVMLSNSGQITNRL